MRKALVFVVLAATAGILLRLATDADKSATRPVSLEISRDEPSQPSPDDHQFRVGDVRTYSIELLSKYRIPSNYRLFAQGELIARSQTGGAPMDSIWLADEQVPEKKLICYMNEDEFSESTYLDKIGDPVQVSGRYVGRDGYGLDLVDCRVASATNHVIRSK